MGRPHRLQIPGAIYHVTTRGAGPCAIFRDDLDRESFLGLFFDVTARHRWACLAYCLMTTHYHALLETPDADLAAGMHRLNGLYARRFNERHGRRGHLFGARYHAELVEREPHLLEAIRYLALNPVRAGACLSPVDWPWSSYAAAIGARAEPLFATSPLASAFGSPLPDLARAMRSFVEEAPGPARPASAARRRARARGEAPPGA